MNSKAVGCAVLLAAIVLAFTDTLAETKTIQCDPPQGQRVEYGTDRSSDAPIWLEDGFTGVRPIFVFDDKKPDELTIFWGDTRPEGVPIELVPATKKSVAQVISDNPIVLAAAMVGALYVETYVFFFKEGSDVALGTFGSHKVFADGAKADMLSSLCKVSRTAN